MSQVSSNSSTASQKRAEDVMGVEEGTKVVFSSVCGHHFSRAA